MISGTNAGVIGTLVGQPLDLVKTRMQTQPDRYSGAINCLVTTWKSEGFLALFKGTREYLGTPMKNLRIEKPRTFSELEFFPSYLAAGAFTGFSVAWVSTPFESIKTRLQVDNISQKRFKNAIQCAICQAKEEGLRGFFRGNVTNINREVLFGAVYFGLYEHMKEPTSYWMSPDVGIAVTGGLSGVAAWLCSFPFDVIKSKIQTATPGHPDYTKSGIAIGRELLNTKGVRGFLSGIGPSLLRALFVSATRFSVFELTMDFLSNWNSNQIK